MIHWDELDIVPPTMEENRFQAKDPLEGINLNIEEDPKVIYISGHRKIKKSWATKRMHRLFRLGLQRYAWLEQELRRAGLSI